MSFFSFFRKKEKPLTLVLDIGSGSVGAGIISLDEHLHPVVIYTTRIPIATSEKSTTKLLSATMASVKSALAIIDKYHKKEMPNRGCLDKAIVSIASPWYVSLTKKLLLEDSNKPILFTKKLIEDAIAREEASFEKNSGLKSNDPFVLEKSVVQARLNGYETNNPYNKKARSVELSMYFGLTSKGIAMDIQNSINSVCGIKIVDIHSFPFIAYNIIRDVFADDRNFLFMDIAGEVTDIISVRDGFFGETASFPSGRNMLVEKIASVLKITTDVATSQLNLYADGDLSGEEAKKIENIVNQFENDWLSLAQKTINSMNNGMLGISKIFIVADGDVEFVFSEYIKKIKEGVSPVVIGKDSLANFITYATTAPVSDEFIDMLALYAYRRVK